MKCKVCGIKIQGKQYVGLGKQENVCSECAIKIIKGNMPNMRENYLEAHSYIKEIMRKSRNS